jgi:hypothetical protein
MTYKSLPIARALPVACDIDGRSYEQQMADFDRKHGVEEATVSECHYEVYDNGRWQETAQGSRFDEWWMGTIEQ